jgi:signal peptidase I
VLARRAVQGFWVALVPLCLVGLVFRYLIPTGGAALSGAVAALAHGHTLLFAVALYFVFSGLARYWRHQLPGGRFAWAERERQGATTPDAARWRRELLMLVAMVSGAIALALAIRAYVARPYEVLSGSMLPTLEPGDLIAGRMHRYDASFLPSRGDVVVFRSTAIAVGPSGQPLPEILVKRVIGLPGDRITMRGGRPIINGWVVPSCDVGPYIFVLPEPGDPGIEGRLHMEFLGDHAYLTVESMGPSFEDGYVVKPGEVFVLGDNRGNSADSRAFNAGHGGGVSLDGIDARGRWFLIGADRGGSSDLTRFLKPLDGLQVRLRLGGVQTEPLEQGIARCLRDRPSDTQPPAR